MCAKHCIYIFLISYTKHVKFPLHFNLWLVKTNSNNELLEEIRKFNNNFSKLQAELAVIKQVNTELTKRIVILELQC